MDKDEITNEEGALEAVKQNGEALRFVPKKLRTEELRYEAMLEKVHRFDKMKGGKTRVIQRTFDGKVIDLIDELEELVEKNRKKKKK